MPAYMPLSINKLLYDTLNKLCEVCMGRLAEDKITVVFVVSPKTFNY